MPIQKIKFIDYCERVFAFATAHTAHEFMQRTPRFAYQLDPRKPEVSWEWRWNAGFDATLDIDLCSLRAGVSVAGGHRNLAESMALANVLHHVAGFGNKVVLYAATLADTVDWDEAVRNAGGSDERPTPP